MQNMFIQFLILAAGLLLILLGANYLVDSALKRSKEIRNKRVPHRAHHSGDRHIHPGNGRKFHIGIPA